MYTRTFAFLNNDRMDLFNFIGEKMDLKKYIGMYKLEDFIKKDIQALFQYDCIILDLSAFTDSEKELITGIKSIANLETKLIIYVDENEDNDPFLHKIVDELGIFNIIRGSDQSYEHIVSETLAAYEHDFTAAEAKRVVIGVTRIVKSEITQRNNYDNFITLPKNLEIDATSENIGYLINFASYLATYSGSPVNLIGYDAQIDMLRIRQPFGKEIYNNINFVENKKSGVVITSGGFSSNIEIAFIDAGVDKIYDLESQVIVFYNIVDADKEFFKKQFPENQIFFLDPITDYFNPNTNRDIYRSILSNFIIKKGGDLDEDVL